MRNHFILILAMLQCGAASLYFGAAHMVTWSALLSLSIVMAVVWAWQRWKMPAASGIPRLVWVALAVLAMALVLPLAVYSASVPPVSSVVARYADAMGEPTQFPSVFSLYHARLALYQWLLPLVLFTVIPAAVSNRRSIYWLAGSLVAVAGCEGVYGVAQTLASIDPLPLFWHPDRQGQVTGTFICRNTYAVYLAAVVPLSLGVMMDLARRRWPSAMPSWRAQFSHHVAENPRLPWLLAAFAAFLAMVLGIVLSLSRGGVACLLLGILLWTWLARVATKRNARSGRLWLWTVVLLLPLAGYFCLIDFDPLLDRFGKVSADSSGRLQLAAVGWRIFCASPVFGCGGDGFRFAVCVYKPPELGGHYRYVHNDFLQFLAEYGLLASLAMVFFLAVWLWCVRNDAGKCTISSPGLWCGCIAGVAVLFFHGIMDFSLQINSQRMLCAVFMAIPLALAKISTAEVAPMVGRRQ